MTAAIWFWLFYVFTLFFAGWWWWPLQPAGQDRYPYVPIMILIGLLGWGVFGSPIK
jgi:cbb3-type cytochrome oxidase subunit 3